MNTRIIAFLIFIGTFGAYHSQQNGRPELGIEGYASASTMGGAFGLGLKYGHKISENVIIGPSFRMIKSWASNTVSQSFSYSIYGAGAFIHARYGNAVFIGAEYEMFKTPMNYMGILTPTSNYASTLFLGGGFSREFKNFVRVNAGVFYDAINSMNSPFRSTYMMKKTNSQTGQVAGYIPVIYRITFFFPLGKMDKKHKKGEEEEEVEEEN